MSTYDKFEQILKERGETAADVAKSTGIAKSTFSGWKHGRFVPKKEKLERIADHFNISVNYFYGNSFTDEQKEVMRGHLEKIYEVSAGNGRLNDGCEYQEHEEGEVFRATVVGDSMLPSLHDGDVVKIVAAYEVEPSDYALVRINGNELSVKHCEVTSDGLWVRGENPDAYTDTFYTIQQCITLPVQVIGKAISFERRLL